MGCSEKKTFSLDKDDIHFAGFYSDYLLQSGVAAGNEDGSLVALDAGELNTLLLRHALNRELLSRKMELYRDNPGRWRSVLVLVRENIRKKRGGGQ
ncbi:MAG: hypothetical protein HGA70_10080 [Chlorobiaceae bacterium]|nr:hypothetical protein [Chlorobiaceae bacterium]